MFALFGIILMALVAGSYYRGSKSFRNVTKDLLLLLVAFVFFVVVIDVVHAAIDLGPFFE